MNKFYDIYLDLAKEIKERKYLSGELLPTESKLSEKYKVSRETIRKAQNLLVENGYILKKQGRGATVLDIDKFKISASSLYSFSEIRKKQSHDDIETILLKNKKEYIQPSLAKKLDLHEKTEVICLERLRKINGDASILDKDYILASIVPSIAFSSEETSLFNYIEKHHNLKIGYAYKEITMESITEEDKLLLNIAGDTHVAVISSEVYLEDTRLFQIHQSRHKADAFKFIDFARRKL